MTATNDEIKAACQPFDKTGRYAQWTKVVYRLSDAPPAIGIYGELPFYVHDRNIWGAVTPEAERMVEERTAEFRKVWGR